MQAYASSHNERLRERLQSRTKMDRRNNRISFDAEKFILEIEARKAIWDTSCEDYCNRDMKKTQWGEVVDLFGGEDLSDDEKEGLELKLRKKWKNIRSCYAREIRRLKQNSSDLPKCFYIFYNQLSFLKNSVNNTEHSTEESPSTQQLKPRSRKNNPNETKKKRNRDDNDDEDDGTEDDDDASIIRKLIKTLSKYERRHSIEHDEDRMFIMSLLTSFRNIPEHNKSAAKIQLIRIIESFRNPQNTFLNKLWQDESENQERQSPSTSSTKKSRHIKRNIHTSRDSN